MVDVTVSTRRARKCVRGLGRGILWTPTSSHTVRAGESCPASMWLTGKSAQTSGINTNHPTLGPSFSALPGMLPFLPLAWASGAGYKAQNREKLFHYLWCSQGPTRFKGTRRSEWRTEQTVGDKLDQAGPQYRPWLLLTSWPLKTLTPLVTTTI